MDVPPIISPKPPPLPPAKKPFAFQAAQASLFAPFVSIFTSIIVNGSGRFPLLARGIAGISCILLILLGLIFGIVALSSVRHYGKREILGKAIAGTCINGILIIFMLISIPILTRTAERAKEIQRLHKAIGIVTVDNVFTEVIPAGRTLPYTFSDAFANAVDNQKVIGITIGQKDESGLEKIIDAQIDGLPPKPKGTLRVIVTIYVSHEKELRLKATVPETACVKEFGPFLVQ